MNYTFNDEVTSKLKLHNRSFNIIANNLSNLIKSFMRKLEFCLQPSLMTLNFWLHRIYNLD